MEVRRVETRASKNVTRGLPPSGGRISPRPRPPPVVTARIPPELVREMSQAKRSGTTRSEAIRSVWPSDRDDPAPGWCPRGRVEELLERSERPSPARASRSADVRAHASWPLGVPRPA